MDELVKSMQMGESVTTVVTIWSVIFGVGLSAILGIWISFLYRKVQFEASYSQSLVHTFVVLAMITSLIMLIIGSNIARAFSLVGALSIVRFRTAIKSPQDIGFIFLTIAIGMACGTRFYSVAIVGTALISMVIFLMYYFNFAANPTSEEFLLNTFFHLNVDYESALKPILGKFFEAYSISYIETVRQGTLREVVYSVRPKPDISDKEIFEEIAKINDNLKVSLRKINRAIDVP
tara:strand:- start:149 stop:850 length:702 start_codon:yes stop_codon:yes gene_type:complete